MKGFNVTVWHGLYAPKGTPQAVLDKINAALKVALKDPAFEKSQEALAATIAWGTLLPPRTAHHRAAISNTLVLPAGGAVLCWLLLTTLWLPLLNYARSYAPLVEKATRVTGPSSCLQYAGIGKAQGAALTYHAHARLMPMQAPQADCPWLIVDKVNRSLLSAKIQSLGWVEEAAIKRPTDKDETWLVYRPATGLNMPSETPSNKSSN